ncbi:3-deoxy-D-manno-octulosonic acid transferase [Winogradskyella sp. A2]|uniref:3-deoxy-D-manno-octulosonic acid transferase n=1 Tax=Winogradskyella sp. A2 TaxID=3366944 RepID=UPI00398C5F75
MKVFYNIGIYIAGVFIKIFAVFNPKLKLGVAGRKDTFYLLKSAIDENDNVFWFHCASLGEYEQGLPVFEALKEKYLDFKIVLSFFSPSGYEIRKNADIADIVVYLPLDTNKNAKRFLDLVNPTYVIFVKYEIWPNLLNEIKKRKINAILISALFRENQSFFKWYGTFMSKAIFAFKHIFTQDEKSKQLLETIEYHNVTISGDTRFDRVSNQLKVDNSLPFLEQFINDKLCFVFGSTWPEDDKLYIDFINNNSDKDVKYVIAPHNIKPNYIASYKAQLKGKYITFSEMNSENFSDYNIFILDTIGYLSKAYSYADIAYVGGGAGSTGLHNILEPAVFGIPIIIGKNYEKFPEAKALLASNGLVSVNSKIKFDKIVASLINNVSKRKAMGTINENFIKENKGAVNQILDYIRI